VEEAKEGMARVRVQMAVVPENWALRGEITHPAQDRVWRGAGGFIRVFKDIIHELIIIKIKSQTPS
jgi:hypothetical protein